MKTLGFSNFKLFKECPNLELTGVNYLVGKNNSGKTSFTHAARLAANFINQIDDSSPDSGMAFSFDVFPESSRYKGYNNIVHKGWDKNEIDFYIDYGDFVVNFEIGKKYNPFGYIKNEILSWVDDSYFEQHPDSKEGPTVDPVWLQTEIDKEIERLKKKNPEQYEKLLKQDLDGKGQVSFIHYYDKRNRIWGIIDLTNCCCQIVFNDFPVEDEEELDHLQSILPTLADEDKVSVQDRIAELMSERESSLYSIKNNSIISKGLVRKKDSGLPVFWSIERLVENSLVFHNPVDSIEEIIGINKERFDSISANLEINNRRARLKDFGENFSHRMYHHIPSRARHITHFTDDEDSNAVLFLMCQHFAVTEDNKLMACVNKWLSALEIGNAIDIKSENERSVCFIKKKAIVNGKSIEYEAPYESFGVGSRQLITLLLNLALVISLSKKEDFPSLVTIEEPEQNLHPAIQSKLADMFLDFYLQFGCQSIIETHSEYIIRRSQVLVAEGIKSKALTLENNHIRVFYFPDNGNQPYDMGFKENGRFERSFGPGFLDVAGNANLELLDLSGLIKK